MTDIMRHKNFIGSVHYSTEDEIFFGRLEGVNDLVTFEGKSVNELKKSFKVAVEDYLELCNSVKKDPEKMYKGSFNIRINPELHKQAVRKSFELGVTLNKLVETAIANIINRSD